MPSIFSISLFADFLRSFLPFSPPPLLSFNLWKERKKSTHCLNIADILFSFFPSIESTLWRIEDYGLPYDTSGQYLYGGEGVTVIGR